MGVDMRSLVKQVTYACVFNVVFFLVGQVTYSPGIGAVLRSVL